LLSKKGKFSPFFVEQKGILFISTNFCGFFEVFIITMYILQEKSRIFNNYFHQFFNTLYIGEKY